MTPLHEQLRDLADLSQDPRRLLIEAADRLELLEGLYEDQVEITRNWKLAADARWDRIKRLEEATQDRDKEWFQVIESVLGFHPVSITDALRIGIERIKKQKQRIKRLEEAGDDLYVGWRSERNNKDKYLENWKQAKEAKP